MQSFTSVVGPNGSGKSNVIDAMLFVFGKRAKQVCYTGCLLLSAQVFGSQWHNYSASALCLAAETEQGF